MNPKVQTLSAQSHLSEIAKQFPLPWSHYVKLLAVKSDTARAFYETEALRGGWTVRQLDRQINSLFYERTALSRNKAAGLTKGAKPKPEDAVTPEEEIKDPLVLEFLGLNDRFSEYELETARLDHLQEFLLEPGNEFLFWGRQKRLRIDDQWYRVDLVLYHRRLRCLMILDFKLGNLTHADVGQMHLYCNDARALDVAGRKPARRIDLVFRLKAKRWRGMHSKVCLIKLWRRNIAWRCPMKNCWWRKSNELAPLFPYWHRALKRLPKKL